MALCAGMLGLELGIRLSGSSLRTVVAVENEAFAVANLVKKIKEGSLDPFPIWSDVRHFDGRAWRGKVDIITAGFPCQPFSSAGNRKGAEDSRWLWDDIARVVGEVEPELLFLENVPGLFVRGFGRVLASLAQLGFDAEWDVFSAAGVGAPHLRRRLFILAYTEPGRLWLEHWWRDGPSREVPAELGNHGPKEPMADTHSGRLQVGGLQEPPGIPGEGRREPDRCSEVRIQPDPPEVADTEEYFFGRGQDQAAAAELWRYGSGQCSWWAAEPGMGRVAHGIPTRMERLALLGNAVVPAVAAKAWIKLCQRALIGATGLHSLNE